MSTDSDFQIVAFNPETCIRLHNELVRRGWEASGQDFDDVEIATWWDLYGAECDEHDLTPRLIPKLVDFLKGALKPSSELTGHDSAYQKFFYHVQGLAMPETMLSENFISEGLDEDPPRYVLLYHVTDLMSHPCGIIFDQKTLQARTVFSLTIEGTIVPEEVRPWVALQTILEQYLEMIDLEKVKGVSEDLDSDSGSCSDDGGSEGNEKVEMKQIPWVLQPHSKKIMDRTLAAYQNLIRAIEERMPEFKSESARTLPSPKRQRGLLPALHGLDPTKQTDEGGLIHAISDLVTSSQAAKESFIIKFLRQSIRPSRRDLKFIAPGLRLPSPESLLNQLFQDIDFRKSRYYNPILLFPAKNDDDFSYTTVFPNKIHNPFRHPYDQGCPSYPSGLWISESDLDGGAFDDACRLLLPRHIIDRHENTESELEHCARSTDGFVLEDRGGEGLAAGLYQTSCNPFILRHEVELFRVLESWVGMVENERWEVDCNGVAGGIEKWMEADESEEGSESYRLRLTW